MTTQRLEREAGRLRALLKRVSAVQTLLEALRGKLLDFQKDSRCPMVLDPGYVQWSEGMLANADVLAMRLREHYNEVIRLQDEGERAAPEGDKAELPEVPSDLY